MCNCTKMRLTVATTNNNFEKNDYFRHDSSHNVHVYQFSATSG